MKLTSAPAHPTPLDYTFPTLSASHTSQALAEASSLWRYNTDTFNHQRRTLFDELAEFIRFARHLDASIFGRLQ
ncbi:hypothetical protein [Corynebacterium epidermidicanis]|uniref:Uncharacterized protein n=1 Tax=Corynebacterium epidermidicanis TaxID=1050174 RepID=A0A0G3GNS2_9CORY|nr:hypothetical protein [Corynebacterium epidermidicanis]AKK02190.1 hypothetical protein CEPID_01525 [Corynebacterium epidermidicanis]